MNSEVSRMPEPGFAGFPPVTNEPRRQLSDAIQKRASRKPRLAQHSTARFLQADLWPFWQSRQDRSDGPSLVK